MKNSPCEPKLKFHDDPMFKRVMEDERICRGVLERILSMPVEEVSYHNTEQEMRMGPNGKTIRMDSYLVESNGRIFDVEMQVGHNAVLPLRFRGYQSVLDGGFLRKGEGYDYLHESYIIFICMEDPFEAGLPVYSLERFCREDPNLDFDCRSHWIALNASAWWELDSDNKLAMLLKYLYTGEVSKGDSLIEHIDFQVTQNNNDREWAMTMIDSISIAEEEARIRGRMKGIAEGREEGLAQGRAEGKAQGRAEGKAEGRIEGERRYAQLVSKLMELGRFDDLKLANVDDNTRTRLFEEFGL